jgi:hypothetical protein
MFETYIINLKQSTSRFQRTLEELTKANITDISHFNAIYGKQVDIQNTNKVSPLCKLFCTENIIGCGLSHIQVAKLFFATNKEFCLVVEDDIRILNHKTFKTDVLNLYNKYKHKDIIRLFCQGVCQNNSGLFAGSTAAYILTKKGASIIKKWKVAYHIDVQFFLLDVHNTQLISTYDDNVVYTYLIENIKIFNQKIGFWGKQTCCKVLFLEVKFKYILIFILSLCLLHIVRKINTVFLL